MPKQNLPTDEEYLDSYFQVPAKHINPVLNDPQLMAEMIEDMKNGGLVPPGEDPREFAIKFFDPKESFRGIKTRILTDAARQTLPADLHYSEWRMIHLPDSK